MANYTRFQLRGDTKANWLSVNPILAKNEPAIETDTNRFKIGDGVSTYSQLSYGRNTSEYASVYNVTSLYPLPSGFYEHATAILAIPTSERLKGLIITYETASGVWYTERFIGTNVSGWTTLSNWEKVPDASDVAQLRSDLNERVQKEDDGSSIIPDESDAFYVLDISGNIVAKIDATGISTTDLKVKKDGVFASLLTLVLNKVDKDGNKVLSDNNFTNEEKAILSNVKSTDIFNDDESTFYITDAAGDIIAKINNEGVKSVDFSTNNVASLNAFYAIFKTLVKMQDKEACLSDETDKCGICDISGNIIAEFNKLGLNLKRINLGNTATLFDDSSEEIVITDISGNIVAKIGKNGIESVNTIITNDFANKIAMPKYLYMFSNKTNNIYKQPVIKRNIGNYKLRYSASKLGRQYANMTSIVNPTDLDVLNCTLYKIDEEEFREVDTKETILRCKPQGVGTTPIYAQVMGDSWVHSGFFHYAMKQKGYVPQLNLIGTRNLGYSSTVYTDAYGEGRGGWRMSTYFSIQNSNTACPSPYYHPVGNYRYWGATGYWKLVYDYSISHDQSVFDNYYNQSCSTVCQGIYFNSDGTLKAPNSGDILYDSLNVCGLGVGYVLYNGTTWVTTSTSAYTWAFDYAKYLTMFSEMLGANPPTDLFVSLGINDFSQLANIAAVTTAFSSYKSNADKLIASYLSAVPAGKVIFCLPLSSWGWEDNQAGGNTMNNFTHFCNAKMWEARRLMIEEYDNRDAESIYLVDVGIMIDEDFGYSTTTEIPFSEYEGTEIRKVQGLQTPHPSPSYPNAGMPLAAFIQYFRD